MNVFCCLQPHRHKIIKVFLVEKNHSSSVNTRIQIFATVAIAYAHQASLPAQSTDPSQSSIPYVPAKLKRGVISALVAGK